MDRNPDRWSRPNHRRSRSAPVQPWLEVSEGTNQTEVVGAASVVTVQPWLWVEQDVAVVTTRLVDVAAKREAHKCVP